MKYIFIPAILLLFSCSKKVTTTNTELFDSTFVKETIKFDTVFIAGDTIRLKEWIECDSVTNNPIPFKAAGRSGRASVKVTVSRSGDLVVTSVCDSLAKVIEVMDREIFRLRSEKKTITVIQQPSRWKIWFDVTCRIMAAILLIVIAVRFTRLNR